jgi:hypothetical protein
VPSNDGFVKDFTYTLGWQSRESGWSILPGTTGQDIMGCFAPEPSRSCPGWPRPEAPRWTTHRS